MANPKTPGDRYFERYCEVNGYLWSYEPGADVFGVEPPTKPDYLMDRAGDRAVVEVKYFTTMRETERLMASPTLTASFGGRELYGTLQNAIRAAGDQLAPLARLNLPLVALATNPQGSDVSFDRDDVVSALFGEVKWKFNAENPGGGHSVASGEHGAVLHRERDGKTINRMPHVSAVVTLYGFGEFQRADVYDLSGVLGFTGTPLPRRMFDADDDCWLGVVGSDRYGLLD
jgi:hypothetical protein